MQKRVYLTQEQKEWLRENYLFVSDKAIMEMFGYKNEAAVRKIRQLLGLKRNKTEYKKVAQTIPIVVWIKKEE